MATYDEEVEITIPSISIEGEIEDDTPTDEITIPEVTIDEALVGTIDDPDYVFLYDASVGYTDYTDEAIEDTANDVPILPSPIGAGDMLLIGYERPVDYILILMGTAGVGTYTVKPQYWNGTAWTDLTTLSSYGTADVKATGWYLLCVDKEAVSDWDSYTINGVNACWFSISYVSGTVTTQPLGNRIWVGEFIEEEPVVYLSTSDSISFAESIIKALSKPSSDSIPVSDLSSLNTAWTPRYYDYMVLADNAQFLNTIGDYPYITQTLSLSDMIGKRVDKYIIDGIEILDSNISIINYKEPLFLYDYIALYEYELSKYIVKPVNSFINFDEAFAFFCGSNLWIREAATSLTFIDTVRKHVIKPISDWIDLHRQRGELWLQYGSGGGALWFYEMLDLVDTVEKV